MNRRIILLALAFIAASSNRSFSFSKMDFAGNFLKEQILGAEVSTSIIMVVDADPKGKYVHFIKCISVKELDSLIKKLNSKNFLSIKKNIDKKRTILGYSFIPLKIINNGGKVEIVPIMKEDCRNGLYFRLEECTKEGYFAVKHGIKMVWHSGWVAWHLVGMTLPFAKNVVTEGFGLGQSLLSGVMTEEVGEDEDLDELMDQLEYDEVVDLEID